MPVLQWNPWTEFETFTRELHRVFDLSVLQPLSNGAPVARQPRMDMYETDTAYVLEADLPGMTLDNITVQLAGTIVTIAGERKSSHTGTATSSAHVERSFGTFQRAFTLPGAVQRDAVHATYSNGVLSVTVPKADAMRPRQIPVQAA